MKDLEGVATYIDDILLYAETIKLHEERLQNTLDTLKRAGLKLNNEVPATSATAQLPGQLHR